MSPMKHLARKSAQPDKRACPAAPCSASTGQRTTSAENEELEKDFLSNSNMERCAEPWLRGYRRVHATLWDEETKALFERKLQEKRSTMKVRAQAHEAANQIDALLVKLASGKSVISSTIFPPNPHTFGPPSPLDLVTYDVTVGPKTSRYYGIKVCSHTCFLTCDVIRDLGTVDQPFEHRKFDAPGPQFLDSVRTQENTSSRFPIFLSEHAFCRLFVVPARRLNLV